MVGDSKKSDRAVCRYCGLSDLFKVASLQEKLSGLNQIGALNIASAQWQAPCLLSLYELAAPGRISSNHANLGARAMTKIFTAHTVQDYDSWKSKYDADKERRQAAGFHKGGHFHQPLTATVSLSSGIPICRWRKPANLSAMYANPELLTLREDAGVDTGAIQFWVSED